MRSSRRSNGSTQTRLQEQDTNYCTSNWISGWHWLLRRFMSTPTMPAEAAHPPPTTPCTAGIDGISVVVDGESSSSRSSKSTDGAPGLDSHAPGPSAAEEHYPPAVPATRTAVKVAAQQAHAAAAKAAAPAPTRSSWRKVPEGDPPAAAAPASEGASTVTPSAPSPPAAPAAASSAAFAAPPLIEPPTSKPPVPKTAARGAGLQHKKFVIGGMSFEVDSRYVLKSVVGKGAYGLVCAAEDTLAMAAPSGAPPEAAAHSMVAVKKIIDPFHDRSDRM